MKPRNTQSSIRYRRNGRDVGDAPIIGEVAKFESLAGAPSHARRERRYRFKNSLESMKWNQKLLVIGGGLVALCLVSLMIYRKGSKLIHEVEIAENQDGWFIEEVVQTKELDEPSYDLALDIVKRGLAIRDEEQVSELFRTGTVSPSEIVDFLMNLDERDGLVSYIKSNGNVEIKGKNIVCVEVGTVYEGAVSKRLVFLLEDENGHLKIDYDSFARYVSPSWDDLLNLSDGDGLIRVMMVADPVHEDDVQWQKYSLFSPDTDLAMLGYCRKGTQVYDDLRRIIDTKQPLDARKRVSLAVKKRAGLGIQQFEITQLISPDWVIVE